MDLFQTNLIVILMAMGFLNTKEEELLDQFSHEYCSSSSSELCVPQDKLQDLNFLFVNNDFIISFNNDLISGFNNDSISGFNHDSISSLNNDLISGFNNDSISSSEISVTQEEDDSSNVESRIVDEKSSKWDFYKEYYSSDEKETIRRCRHCKTEKTPQWRMGPLGRKTLCNACGVRYRAGKLLPEYRPAASPTFDGSKHSNFHKRIMRKKKKNYEDKEGYSNLHKRVLRRKKENYEEEEEGEGGFLQLVRPYIGYA